MNTAVWVATVLMIALLISPATAAAGDVLGEFLCFHRRRSGPPFDQRDPRLTKQLLNTSSCCYAVGVVISSIFHSIKIKFLSLCVQSCGTSGPLLSVMLDPKMACLNSSVALQIHHRNDSWRIVHQESTCPIVKESCRETAVGVCPTPHLH